MIKSATSLTIGDVIWDETKQHVKFVNYRVVADLESSDEPLPYSYVNITPQILIEWCDFERTGDRFYSPSGLFIQELPSGEYIVPFEEFKAKPFKYLHEL